MRHLPISPAQARVILACVALVLIAVGLFQAVVWLAGVGAVLAVLALFIPERRLRPRRRHRP